MRTLTRSVRFWLTVALVVFASSPALPKSTGRDCNQNMVDNGKCEEANLGQAGGELFYWLPNGRMANTADSLGYPADGLVLCEATPDPIPDMWGCDRVWHDPADPSATERYHCLASEIGQMVAHPLTPKRRYVDCKVHEFMRNARRNFRTNENLRAAADDERSKPIEEFEDCPERTGECGVGGSGRRERN